jgi:hypothetical protein
MESSDAAVARPPQLPRLNAFPTPGVVKILARCAASCLRCFPSWREKSNSSNRFHLKVNGSSSQHASTRQLLYRRESPWLETGAFAIRHSPDGKL